MTCTFSHPYNVIQDGSPCWSVNVTVDHPNVKLILLSHCYKYLLKILWWLLYMQDAGSFQYSPRCSQIVFPHKKERGEVVNKRLGSIHCI